MNDDTNIELRLPCTSVEPYEFGDYTVFGHLPRPDSSPALFAASLSADEKMQILRPFSRTGTILDFHDLNNLSRRFGRYAQKTALEIDSSTYVKSPAFVSEPLSLILARCLEHGSPLPLSLSVSICKGILQALQEAGAGQIHGALTPDHVLIGFDGSVAVVDPAGNKFGHELSSASKHSNYRSPEHINGSELSAASDIFLVGIYLYEMTTGGHAFLGDTEEISNQITAARYRRPRSIVGRAYPIELQVVLRKLLNSNLEMRFDSLDVALDGLSLVISEKQKQQRKVIQSYMHKTYPERYEAWMEIFSQANITLPRLEITEPAAQPGALLSSRKTGGVDDYFAKDYSTDSAETALVNLMAPLMDTKTDGEIHRNERRDDFGQELSTNEVKRPATPRTLPPLSASPREETMPAVNPENLKPNAIASTPIEAVSYLASEPTSENASPPQRPKSTDELDDVTSNEFSPTPEQVPAFSSGFEGTAHSIDENTVVSQAQTRDEVSLIDTSDLSLEDDSPLNETDLAHLRLAADLIEQRPDSTDRHPVSAPSHNLPGGENKERQTVDVPRTNDAIPSTSETVPQDELAILQPRKIMERDDSGWAKAPNEEPQKPDAFDLSQPTDSAVTPTSRLPEFESDAVSNTSSETGIKPNTDANLVEAAADADVEIAEPTPLTPADYQSAEAFREDSLLSEALVLPVSDTSLDREYLRQKKLIRIAVIGVVILSSVVLLLLRQLLLERVPSEDVNVVTQQLPQKPAAMKGQANSEPDISNSSSKGIIDQNEEISARTSKTDNSEITEATKSSSSALQPKKEAVLQVSTTTISVMAFPLKKAQLFLDGQPLENGSNVIITDKERVLVIKAKGYVTFQETLKPGRTSDVQILLTRKKRRKRR
ncbi:MAG: hypothetical protein VYC39_19750 [Myxococcota bacterium]|nr:hypothetical protein [Myxococcota bacterium]